MTTYVYTTTTRMPEIQVNCIYIIMGIHTLAPGLPCGPGAPCGP